MKLIGSTSILALLVMLIGCGHGYEGQYISKAGSSNSLIGSIASSLGSEAEQRVVVGSDYLESGGERVTFDEIFVRNSGEERYLVFKDSETEEAWEILDENTLLMSMGFMNVKLIKID